jgi:CPA2 family monovalent cation:H+ antiporter-2
MVGMGLAYALFLILLAGFLGGFIAKRLRQPLILGYILAGIVVGALALPVVSNEEAVKTLAEIGVALLMFTLGIEFSLTRLKRVREIALWGGLIQILLTILLGLFIFPRLGFDFYASLFMAAAFSLSSTAVVTKLLSEKGELDSLPGEIMVGWLLIQDLAVLPMLAILPQVAVLETSQFWRILLSVGESAILLVLVIILGKGVINKILDRIASVGSRELLLLSVVTLCLAAAFGTHSLGLSFALGAFLAGLMVAESSQNHAIFSEIRPLRDIFVIIFFVSLGMIVPPSFILTNLLVILTLVAIILLIKFIIVLGLVFYLGYHTKTAFLVAVGLVQVGEFSFVLARTGINQGVIGEEIYNFIIAVALVTIVLTPLLFEVAPRIYQKVRSLTGRKFPKLYSLIFTRFDHRQGEEGLPLENHVIICGYGRVGGWLGRALEMVSIPFVVVDYNFKIVADLKKKGVPVVYGDPGDIDVLSAAQAKKAKSVIIAIPDRHTQELVISHCQTLNPQLAIICRTHYEEDQPRLKALGVKAIIQPEFEASLSMIHRVLQIYGLEKEDVAGKIKRIKIEHGMS